MGTPVVNMAMLKLMLPVALLLAINLHSAEGQCQLPSEIATNGVAASGVFSTLSDVSQACTTACLRCGQAAAADMADTFTTGLDTAAEMTALANSICPAIAYSFVVHPTAQNTQLPSMGVAQATAAVATVPGMLVRADTGGTSTEAFEIVSHGFFTVNTVTQTAAGIATLTTGVQVCPCLTTTTGGTGSGANTCPICTCSYLGIPTMTPTQAPTSFPTQHVEIEETSSYSFSDDALSAGDIAGIVIGAVGGSFLFLLIGVLVGGMVGGKSAAPAAPAGQL